MARLTIRLLGGFHVELEGQPAPAFESDKTRALLAYLAVEADRPHRREVLAELLWPDRPASLARANLRQTLHRLRDALAAWHSDPSGLIVTPRDARLAPSAASWLDVAEFLSLLDACKAHHSWNLSGCEACRERLQRAVALYRGDFLAGFSLSDSQPFDEWALLEQEKLRSLGLHALDALTSAHLRSGDYEGAAGYARRQLELEPWREEAHAQLMRALALSGQRDAALRQFELCRRVLADELDEEPSPGLVALLGRVRDRSIAFEPLAEGPGFWSGEDPDPLPRTQDSGLRFQRFVAREGELAALDVQLTAALARRGRVVFVTGEVGSGKTALLAEFATRAMRSRGDLLVATGQCAALGGVGDPYLPFREVFRMLAGDVELSVAGGAMPGEHADRMLSALPEVAQALVEAAPDLVDHFGVAEGLLGRVERYGSGSAPWRSQLEALARRQASRHELDHQPGPGLPQTALFEQATAALRAVARRHPLLLLLDDLQWVDSSSSSLLFHLGKHLAGSAILVAGAYRREGVEPGRDRERHPLQPVVNELQRDLGEAPVDLDKVPGRSFVEALLDSEPNLLGDEFRETLFRRTGGNALFTVELLRDLRERGDLSRDEEGRWTEGAALDWDRLPVRVEAAIAERVGQLPAGLRAALSVASVEGDEFTAEVVARIQGLEKEKFARVLSGVLSKRYQMVTQRSFQRLDGGTISRYRFRHYLFQQYLYRQLDEGERARLHGSVGSELEALYGTADTEIAPRLASHFEQAGLVEKALEYLLGASEAATRVSGHSEAIEYLNRGISLLLKQPESPQRDRRELDFRLSSVFPLLLARGWGSRDLARSIDRARDLGEILGDTSQLKSVLALLGFSAIGRSQFGEAIALTERLRAIAEDTEDRTWASVSHQLESAARMLKGDVLLAHEQAERALSLYDPEGARYLVRPLSPGLPAICLLVDALALWELGYPERSLRKVEEAMAHARSVDDLDTLRMAITTASASHFMRREYETAREMVTEAERLVATKGDTHLPAWLAVQRGRLQVWDGQAELGLALIRRGIRGWQDTGTMPVGPWHLQLLAEACLEAEQIELGLKTLHETSDLPEDAGGSSLATELERLRGELLLARGEHGDIQEAEACFARAIEMARRQDTKSWELRAAMSLARLWQRQEKTRNAKELLGFVYGWFTEGFDTPDLADARRLLAEL